MAETEPTFYVLSDIDNVQALTTPDIVRWGNTWGRRAKPLVLEKYREPLHEFLGVSLEEGNVRWQDFCQNHMINIQPDPEMQHVITNLPSQTLIHNMTSRARHTAAVTSLWVAMHYPKVEGVLHAITDWTNDPHAHLKTKAESIATYIASGEMPRLPDVIIDDEPKHVLGANKIGIGHCVLYGDYPWNKYAQDAHDLVWIPRASLLEEYLLEAYDEKMKKAA